jgi:hypothetical protein
MRSAFFSASWTLRALAPVVVSGCLLACSSSSSDGTNDGGLAAPDAEADGPGATNPYGIPYPNNNIGTHARKCVDTACDAAGGSIPGNQIQNFSFLGYPNGDSSKGLQTIALSDFYDPEGKLGYKLLHLGAAAVWCVPCNQETKATVPLAPGLLKQGVVFAQTLENGTTLGQAATQTDLDNWISEYKPTFTEMLDPDNMNLGVFFAAAEVPWNAIIDARSMEVLADGVGYSGNVMADLQPWITWVAQNQPSYPASQ